MSRTYVPLALLFLIAGSAFAQNPRSAVSSSGNDANPCTVISPCRSFGVAFSHTNPGGEIVALDSAGYGPFTITGPVTVSGAPGVHAAITGASSDAITILAGTTDHVTIRNLVLIGAGASNGVLQLIAGEVYVGGCVIRGFSTHGIESQNGNITVEHCLIQDVPGSALTFSNGGPGFAHATVSDSTLEWSGDGAYVDQKTKVALVRCVVAENGIGVTAVSTSGVGSLLATMTVKDSSIVHNTVGVETTASGGNNSASVSLSNNLVAYNGTAVESSGVSTVFTFFNNTFAENDNPGSAMNGLSLQ